MSEINRAIEFQRGTVGATESAKEDARPLTESSDIGLGPGDRAFEPHYSDQKPSEIVDFRGLFLFFVYCGAKGEAETKYTPLAQTTVRIYSLLTFSEIRFK